MSRTIQAGLVYFAMVLGAGIALGLVRVPFLVPRIGERWAELLEMPIMAIAIYLAAGAILRQFPEIGSPRRSIIAGVLALALMVAVELALAALIRGMAPAEFIASRDPVSGSVYLVLLLVFAVMPWLRLSRVNQVDGWRQSG
ncbi:hypothetical protein [Cyanobium sp. LEGE 06113]|uniref:hypothetical protein n=1 Tax=Cyanobium sp. LEGE 06113 TaxID=1297573 RepID=UPI00187E200D|nr:hypothetical protein [Cyanobium sp. LEGE 06113]MBE9152564.1 hypothetical protein [Cyanobium sp. LEGE 06113]MBE9153231.1 hypothetical protein [Cyanobium sp. LEGE 06113]